MSQPASFMAATASGFRCRAVATPNTVTGSLRPVKIRHSRQKPAREPYSNIDSILAWSCPGQGCAPSTSDKNASEARSPCRMLFSPPSSKFTTNCTAMRALPGQCGCGGLRPSPRRYLGYPSPAILPFLDAVLFRTFVEPPPPERVQVLKARRKRDEVIAGQLAHLACKMYPPIG